MLRTNSKQARENIRAYISEIYTPEGYDLPETRSFRDIATNIYNAFKAETGPRKHNHFTSEQNIFIEWASGLPSIIDTCYYYNRPAVTDLGDILEETETERARFTEAEAENLLSILIYREIKKAVEK